MALPAPQTSPAPAPSILTVLRRPGVASTFALNVLAKLPLAAVGLLMLIRVSAEYGYAAAGIVDALFAIGMGVSGAVWGRVVQHVPMARVVLPLSVINGGALLLAGILPADAPYAAFAAVGLLMGLTEPPFGGTMRALWDQLLERAEERHVGYSLDGAANEALFVVSPAALVGGVASLAGPDVALMTAGGFVSGAGAAFALARAVRAAPASEREQRSTGLVGALRHPGVRTAVALTVAVGAHMGPIEVGITAFGRAHGGDAVTGALFAAWAVGSSLAGLALARFGPTDAPVRRMVLCLAWTCGASLLLLTATSGIVLGIMLVGAGIGLAPALITLNGAFDRLAPSGAEAEIFNLTNTGVMLGIVFGTPLAGVLVDAFGPRAGFALGVAGTLAGIALLLVRRRDFDRAEPTPADGPGDGPTDGPGIAPALASSER